MRDKHLHIAHDSELWKTIRSRVNNELVCHTVPFTIALWGKFVFYFLLSVSTYALLLATESPVLFVLCFVSFGFAILLFAFNFAHDFAHGTVYKKAIWNNLGFIAIYTLNGAHAEAWKKRHIESHHFAPNVEHYDSDLEISNLIRVIPHSRYKWFHRFQHLYAPLAYTTYSLYWVFVKDFHIFGKGKSERTPRYALSFFTQKLFYIAYLVIAPVAFSLQPWPVVLLGFVAMHLAQSLFLLFTFFMTHHVEGVEYPATDKDGFILTSWLMNQIKCSNDMHPFSTAANFVFGGFNNHIAHHLFPNVHHIHYPRLNRILYRTLQEHGITPNQTTYWGGVCSHLRLLKRMGAPVSPAVHHPARHARAETAS